VQASTSQSVETSPAASVGSCTQCFIGGGALKTQVLENASTEKASTKQRNSQGWKTHVRKTQVRKMQVQCKPSYQSDTKRFGTSQVRAVHFQVGWASGLQIVFSEIK